MLHEIAGLPPAILLLISEVSEANSWEDARKRLKRLLPELATQSEVFLAADDCEQPRVRKGSVFAVHMHGALDLFMRDGCMELPCRLKAADHLARSVGLIADEVWLTDTFSIRALTFGRATNRKLDALLADTMVLTRLAPLIEAGIVKFRRSSLTLCRTCHDEFETRVASLAARLVPEFRRDFKVRDLEGGGYMIDTGKCFDPPLLQRSIDLSEASPTARSAAERIVCDEVRSALWAARDAAVSGGSIFSNSRVALTGLLREEGRQLDRRSLLRFEREREFQVPWVSSLEPQQVVQLRKEAFKALPSFRNAMARALAYSGDALASRDKAGEIVEALRSQADEVREELSAKRKASARYWRTSYALLGLGLSAYGVASDQAAAGVAGLLPLIQLLIEHKTGHESDVEQLEHRPGFVLVKAQQLLEHAHDGSASGT